MRNVHHAPDAPAAEQEDGRDVPDMPRVVVDDELGITHDCAKPFTKTDMEGRGHVLSNCGLWVSLHTKTANVTEDGTVTCLECIERWLSWPR